MLEEVIMEAGLLLVNFVIRHLAMRLVLVSTGTFHGFLKYFEYLYSGHFILLRRFLNASSVENVSREAVLYQHTFWFTVIPDLMLVNIVERDFTRSQIWKSTLIFTQVCTEEKSVFCNNKLWTFSLALMGALAPGSAHARPSAQAPIDTSENFRRKCLGVGAGANKIPIKFLAISGDSKHFSFFSKKKP